MRTRRGVLGMALFVLALIIFSGCKGNPLPEGMEEEELIAAGQEMVALLNERDYEAVADRFREDVREHVTAESVSGLVDQLLNEVGDYKKEDKTLATGQTNEETGEFYGIAVILCTHAKDDVMYRLAFDSNMTLIGLSVSKQ